MDSQYFNDKSDKKVNTDKDRVFAGLALSVLEPKHKWAYRFESCHTLVAKAMHNGHVSDDDEIVLVGRGNEVYHSLVARDGVPIVDDYIRYNAPFVDLDLEKGVYAFQDNFHAGIQEFDVIAHMTYAKLKSLCNKDTLDVSKDAEFPDYIPD